jgi:hypothetical protein
MTQIIHILDIIWSDSGLSVQLAIPLALLPGMAYDCPEPLGLPAADHLRRPMLGLPDE